MAKKDQESPDDWIPITQAAVILKIRYLKARDLMTQGKLGEIHTTDTNRYFVRRSNVEAFAAERS